MKYASDFRSVARDALRGKWAVAVVVGLIAALLGGVGQEGPELKLNIDMLGASVSFEYAGQTIISTGGGLSPEVEAFITRGIPEYATGGMILETAYIIIFVIFLVLFIRHRNEKAWMKQYMEKKCRKGKHEIMTWLWNGLLSI